MSLRYKIISLFILAIILPAFLLSIVLTSISRRSLRNSIFSQQQEILKRVTDRISSQIDRHQQLLLINRDINRLDGKQSALVAKDILKQGEAFSEIALLSLNGKEEWKYEQSGKVYSLLNRSKREEFLEARKGHEYISPVFFSGQRTPYIMLSVPASRNNGVLVAKLDLDRIWKWIREIKIGDSGHAFVVDHKGNLVAHQEPARVWAHSDFSNLQIVKDFIEYRQITPANWRQYKDERGRDVVSLYQSLPKMGWAVITQIPSREVYRPIRKMYQSVILWTFLWTTVFLFIGFRFVRRIINPISLLQSEVQKISQGKLDIHLDDIKTGDEIEELAGNFKKMAQSLKDLEQLRQDLTRMIIHDLKSPLSGIMGSLDYLETGMMGELNKEQKTVVELAKKSSENLLVMIQNMLDVAKMEEGKLTLRKEKFDMAKLLIGRQRQFEALTKRENKTISVDIEKDIPTFVEIEGQLIERVLNNLISNAINHTTTGGQITLGVKKAGNFLEVKVSDTGVGVPPEYKDKIFEKFVHVERKQAKLRTGVGLGLTFCKMTVEAHGGAIRVESELNKGSAFIFTLPLSSGHSQNLSTEKQKKEVSLVGGTA
ncbi:MAG: sensor histidine kinase [Endomicrobiales bacterium]|nr:sensor histidine kinase [Endomicrobiales bacterium]